MTEATDRNGARWWLVGDDKASRLAMDLGCDLGTPRAYRRTSGDREGRAFRFGECWRCKHEGIKVGSPGDWSDLDNTERGWLTVEEIARSLTSPQAWLCEQCWDGN